MKIFRLIDGPYLGPIAGGIVLAFGASAAVYAQSTYAQSTYAQSTYAQSTTVIPLKKGLLADYGATPWHTTNTFVGTSPIRFTLDTGSPLLWATSDRCQTDACQAHLQVDTGQADFSWIKEPPPPISKDFGPWGKMDTGLGYAPFVMEVGAAANVLGLAFYAATDYRGLQFSTLAWDGGIGFPSESASVDEDDFYFHQLYLQGQVRRPAFSYMTDGLSGTGQALLGDDDPSWYDEATEVVLAPKKSADPGLQYLWGTTLYAMKVGEKSLPALKSQLFYLDTGSSRFKGDAEYVYPIMQQLLTYKDAGGRDIFEKYYEEVKGELTWTGLKYANGGTPYDYPDLPDLSLILGESCRGSGTARLSLSLSPEQYSYRVDIGERAGEWVVAVHLLNGVGGLLVGSTLMDLVYTRFEYEVTQDQQLSQGWMYLFRTSRGEQPAAYTCIPQ